MLADDSADRVPADAPPSERLAAFVAGNLEWAVAHPALATVFARELLAGDPETQAFLLQAASHCVGTVAEILAGNVREDLPPERLAVAFMCHANLLLGQHNATGWPAVEELPTLAASAVPRRGGATRPSWTPSGRRARSRRGRRRARARRCRPRSRSGGP